MPQRAIAIRFAREGARRYYDQAFFIERQQRGVQARSFRGMRLAADWEAVIANMHRELDRRLATA